MVARLFVFCNLFPDDYAYHGNLFIQAPIYYSLRNIPLQKYGKAPLENVSLSDGLFKKTWPKILFARRLSVAFNFVYRLYLLRY